MEDQSLNEQKNPDRFNDFMFGNRGVNRRNDYHSQESSKDSSPIDYEQLVNTIDMIMESVSSLKPIVQSVIGQITKKK
ncbi:MAG: hypothetical protein ACJ8MO_30660 [Bacillus sp. (in: firmicutes)]